jgi:dTDP-4-amino-4,6-dideoxygalactose transaminase
VIPLGKPSLGAAEEALVLDVLRSGRLTRGPMVEAFERQVADYVGAPFAVAVSSGTAALHLGLMALGVGPGDEVIVPDFSFPATANVVRHCGATPVLIDIDLDTMNISIPELQHFVETSIEVRNGVAVNRRSGRPLRAVLPVHLFGLPADMEPILRLGKDLRLAVLEDAAAALGATHAGRFCGTLAAAGCFSFHPRKIVTTGEGGMVVTSDPAIAERVRRLRNHGAVSSEGRTTFEEPGYNCRLGELHAAVGVAQMERIDELRKRLARVAAIYDEECGRLPGVHLPPRDPGRIYQAYVIRLARPDDRERVRHELAARGIETTLGTYSISAQPAYADRPPARHSHQAQETTLALPLYADLSEVDARRVATTLREVMAWRSM